MSFLKIGECAALTLRGIVQSLPNDDSNTEKVQERVTVAFLRVLWFFLANEKNLYCGADVMKQLKLPSGTVYPLLIRMARAGWLNRELEDVNPKEVGRPARRFYQISTIGLKEGKKLINEQCVPVTTTANALIGNMEVA